MAEVNWPMMGRFTAPEGKDGWMSLNYELRREAHAIAEFSATIQFFGAISAQRFAVVTQRLKELAEKLDLPAPINTQIFAISLGGGAIPPPPSQINGSGFQRFSPNGEVACSLICNPDGITFTLREYDRFYKHLPQLIDTFNNLGQEYILETPAIRSFGVQYINEFRARSADAKSTKGIFRKDSKWLASFYSEVDDLWHCHVGQFIPTDTDHRYLVNVNCDVNPGAFPGDPVVRNLVRVLILANCQYDLPGVGPFIVNAENLAETIELNLMEAHSLEKKILGETISADYLAVMGEGANEH